MSALRRGALTIGVVLVGGGLAVVLVPDLAAGVNPTTILVDLVGVLALLVGLAGVRARYNTDFATADLPEPERRTASVVPGADADDRLADLSAQTPYRLSTGHSLTQRVRVAAIDVLASEGHTEAAAETALADGTWTDDPYAAALFTDKPVGLPLWVRVRDALGGESRTRIQARHAIDVLADRSDTSETASHAGDGAHENGGPTDDATDEATDRHATRAETAPASDSPGNREAS